MLAPGIGEIIGGSQREERLEVLDARMAERGIDREHYAPTLPSPANGGGLLTRTTLAIAFAFAVSVVTTEGVNTWHPEIISNLSQF